MSDKRDRSLRFVGDPEDIIILSTPHDAPDSEARINLTELRQRRHATQEQVAERLGVRQTQVSRLERRGSPRLDTLSGYLRALGAETAQLEVTFDDGTRIAAPVKLG